MLPSLTIIDDFLTDPWAARRAALMLDYARTVGDAGLEKMLVDKTIEFHAKDVRCPLAYEPSGEDFLSPCLMEADLMRRVMGKQEFADWLADFLPQAAIADRR